MKRRTSIHKTFRVYLNREGNPRGHFWKVNVFKTRDAMLEYSRSIGNAVSKNGFGAQVQQLWFPYHFKKGTAIFYRGHTDAATVAHEMAHIAIAETPKGGRNMFQRTRKRGSRTDEERFCYLLDSLVEQFYKRYKK